MQELHTTPLLQSFHQDLFFLSLLWQVSTPWDWHEKLKAVEVGQKNTRLSTSMKRVTLVFTWLTV